jgi:hypothetical protein
MDYAQIITAAIALVAVVIALVSLTRSREVQRQQLRLHKKQEDLTDRQLEMLQRQAMTEATASTEKADVRVDIQTTERGERFNRSTTYRLVIVNWGHVPARNVTLEVTPSPLIQSEYEKLFPIKELAPGARVSLTAVMVLDAAISFDGRWSWTDPDGSESARSSLLTL